MKDAVFGLVNGIVFSIAGLFSAYWVKKRKKAILRDRLLKDGWEWRTFESLCRVIREDEPTTRDLLLELGAHASTGQRNVWTMDR